MPIFSPVKLILIGVVAIPLFGTGCATTADLEKLNKELSRKLDATNASVHTQIGELRTDLRGDLAQTLSVVQTESRKVTTELQGVRQAVKDTLLSNYKIEEAALKERLKAVTWARENLEAVPPRN